MEENDPEHHLMTQEGGPPMEIDPERARFPCCIVWTPLPILSWFLPFIGHMGICREDGVILDFAGPNFVCVDNFTFGKVTRYIQLQKGKCRFPHLVSVKGDQYGQDEPRSDILTWDDALRKSTQDFQHRSYNLLTCNCHSFVANSLNRLDFLTGRWNVVNLAVLILFNGKWVSKAAAMQSYLPFVIVYALGLAFGGWTFIKILAIFCFVLMGWFLLGTYSFKSLIRL